MDGPEGELIPLRILGHKSTRLGSGIGISQGGSERQPQRPGASEAGFWYPALMAAYMWPVAQREARTAFAYKPHAVLGKH
jgi:hypothetical protein